MEKPPEFVASSWARELLAGGLGGMAGVVAGHPLDTIRVRVQQSSSPASPSAYGVIRQIITSEGPLAVFKGMLSPLASVAVQNAVTFLSSALFRRALVDPASTEPLSYSRVYLAGAAAGSLQSVILTPVELVKIRLQVQTGKLGLPSTCLHRSGVGPLSVAQAVVKREGMKGLFRGFTITVLRDSPGYGLYFASYEYVREVMSPGCRKNGQESVTTMLTAGGVAGVASWLSVYPLDVIKSRVQAQGTTSSKYTGSIDCFRKSVQEEGYAFLWRGLGITLARAYLVNGVIFVAYEMALRLLFSPSSKTPSTTRA